VPKIINSAELKHTGYLKFIEFIRAENSMADLTYRFDIISNLTLQHEPYHVTSYIDMKLNNVVILHPEKLEQISPNYEFLKAAKKYKPKFVGLYQGNVSPHPRCKEDDETSTSQ
ncbi:25996_t:CDS:1, partial [Racocetra persica]